jgi:hypothetical protein
MGTRVPEDKWANPDVGIQIRPARLPEDNWMDPEDKIDGIQVKSPRDTHIIDGYSSSMVGIQVPEDNATFLRRSIASHPSSAQTCKCKVKIITRPQDHHKK